MRKAFKYRLYPNANQARELAIMLESHRRLYNEALALRREAWSKEQKSLSSIDQQKWFNAAKLENEWYARLHVDSAYGTIRRLDKSFANFFRRIKAKAGKAGYPRFKAHGRFESIEYPHYGNGIRLNGNRLRVLHVGNIKTKTHRPIEGKVKTASLKLEGDKWFVVLSCDLGELEIAPSTAPALGLDVGIESFAVTSDGEHIPNPSWLKNELPELRRRGRAVSRKRKGGANRRKAVRRLRSAHVRVANLRREHHHQLSNKLVSRYGLIAVEGLNVQGMLRNHRLARAIADAGWSAFLNTLHYKAANAGVRVVEVDPKNTSQNCSGCGETVPKKLNQRMHRCVHCGLTLHRDHNAALNILARGLAVRTGPPELNARGLSARVPRTQSSQIEAL